MRTQDVSFRTRIETPAPGELPAQPYLPDRDLTYYRSGVRMSFTEGKLMMNGLDVNRLISNNTSDASFIMGMAESLYDYRKKILTSARNVDQMAKFSALIEALLGKMMGTLKKLYDQKMTGLSWTMQNGQLILNGINVRSFLALYRLRKTDKAKKFLKGLKSKLVVLLENRNESPDYERVHEFIEDLYNEVEAQLGADEASDTSSTTRAHRLLPAPSHHVS